VSDPKQLKIELEQATAELKAHMASWEYAYAMGSSLHGATNHPLLERSRAKAQRLQRRCVELRARLAEHEL
jgi:hypothetical protein